MFGIGGGAAAPEGRSGGNELGTVGAWREILAGRPEWIDGLLLRRVLAGVLALLAGVLWLRDDPGASLPVVVAASDLPPGHTLTAGDVRLAERPTASIPAGAARDPGRMIGSVLAAATARDEIVTDLRVVGPRLAQVAAGRADARLVPIRLADPAVADIVRVGDRIDVVAAGDQDSPNGARTAPTLTGPRIAPLVTDATIVLVTGGGNRSPTSQKADRVILAAMDGSHAAGVAAASLHNALTVVLH